ncbi:MAG: flagellar basal body rod C-terminal domain-containing protein, partial [Planctomycetaceae bacterium]
GQLEQSPAGPGFTGSSSVAVSGSYLGEENDQLAFAVVGTGTVGLDENLQVEVRNSAGALLSSVEIGRGYVPGSEIEIGDGVTVAFGAGTVTTGDTLTLDVIADPDTANVLSALGLNTLFSGTTALDLKVTARLRNDPSAFAASRNGQSGDSGNLLRFATQRDSGIVGGTDLTTEQYLADIVAESGQRVNDLQVADEQLLMIGESLSAERDSISGVSTDEELLNLLKHQRGFQAAAQLISVVERTLDDLLRTLA